MAKLQQYRRLMLLALLVVAAFAGLGYRLVDLQVLRHEDLAARAQANTQSELLIEPRRGDILDCKGNLLATSVPVKTVCVDPLLLCDRQVEVARAIAPVLSMNESEVLQRLTPRLRVNAKGETVTNRYVVLKRKVALETWQKVQVAMTNLTFGLDESKLPKPERNRYRDLRQKAIFVDPVDDQLRFYPNQSLAAHVLGFVGMDEAEVNGRPILQTSGKAGIEQRFDGKLAGVRGWRLTETDHARRELVAAREQDVEPHDGLSVVLTIDSVIQHIVESALAEAKEKHSPISVSGIVVRPRTGEILAMATLPNYDPNNPNGASADARNRIITDIVEPGSTFKIVVLSGALNDGTVKLSDMFDCEHGHFHFAGRILHDHEPYGMLSAEGIITHSSNIGAAKIGLKMGENRLYEYIHNFGFGVRTGLPLPGEVPGIVHPVKDWSKVSIAQIPMGQGIAVTRLQTIMAMCAIANKGVLMQPMLVDHLEDREHNVVAKYPPVKVKQVISEAAAKEMVTALKTVATPDGTAPKAAMEHYTVAGKTGTAQKVERGEYVRKYFTSFIGFFPADNPEVCISVTLDEPNNGYYGGKIAAPVFKQIADQVAMYLNIKPESGDDAGFTGGLDSPLDDSVVKTASARGRPEPTSNERRK
jgi:cell division protein FtsI/penicillin-binding protein 2